MVAAAGLVKGVGLSVWGGGRGMSVFGECLYSASVESEGVCKGDEYSALLKANSLALKKLEVVGEGNFNTKNKITLMGKGEGKASQDC